MPPSQPSEDRDPARRREAALREVLDLISRSRGDEAPVFEAILRRAADLCGADAATLVLGQVGDVHQRLVAHYGTDPHTVALYQRGEVPMDPDISFAAQAIRTGKVQHVADMMDTDRYRRGVGLVVSTVDGSGIRTIMWVPLMAAGGGIGSLNIYRKEVRPYTPDEIALVETFAAQAVIAIENVRQFRELRERLAQEAAAAEILEVISRSRDDDQPVFETIVQNAQALCDAPMSALVLARTGDSAQRLAAHRNLSDQTVEMFRSGRMRMDASLSYAAKSILDRTIINHADMKESALYKAGSPVVRAMVDDVGIRSVLFVPLLSGEEAIGTFALFRYQVAPFDERLVRLVETFAAQAVIAIENVRQFRELQTRLAREAASAEILEVISQSRDDDRPVFDVVLRKAAELCHASMASLNVISEDRSHAVAVAEWGDHVTDQLPVGITVWPMDSDHAPSKCMREGRIVHVHDLADTELYRAGDPIRVTAVDAEGIRTFLAVPLFSGGRTVSCISIYRREVRPFTPDEIALVETFAAQAVIAIENVRQFRELQDSLEQQEATSDILRVISQSREDETRVFDLILEKAAVLCDADQGSLMIVNEARTHVRHMADWGHEHTAYHPGHEYSLDLRLSVVPTIRTAKVVHIEDYSQSDAYRDRDPIAVNLVETEGHRTRLVVPLLQGGIAIGCIALGRREVRPFTSDEIALVETFAAQAVIAIENVRQFRELQTRLAHEAATRRILEAISTSRDDELQVFDAILEEAARLCEATMAGLLLVTDDRTRITYARKWGEDHSSFREGDGWPFDGPLLVSSAIREAKVFHSADLADSDLYRDRYPERVRMVEGEGIRSYLVVPLVSGGIGIGVINLGRRHVGAFLPDQIALVETFAAQAVIAIENVRQFRELQTRLAREAATREILEVISHSRDDDRPVFDAILQNATRLCGADSAALLLGIPEGPHLTLAALWHWDSLSPEALDRFIADINRVPMAMDPALHISARAICSAGVVHIDDLAQTDGYLSGEASFRFMVEDQGVRTTLSVPIFGADGPIGCISVHRNEVRPYSEDEIALIRSFAAQAVIAIENVRQFRELQMRLEREAATRNILRVISESPDDEQPTFEAILDSATRLCGTEYASIVLGRRGDVSRRMVAHRAAMDETVAFFRDGKVLMDPGDSFAARAILEGRTIHVPDMAYTDQYRAGHERFRLVVDRQGLRTNLFVPLLATEGGIGCFILWKKEVAPFTADQIALMETFASHAVIAIENVRQFRALEALNAELGDRVQAQVGEIERMGRLKRFLPAAVADAVVSLGSEKILSSHRALLGVLFCDIRGFTAFCETAEPEETIEVLQTYHEEMGRLIGAHGAGVDHRMGDGIMVLFNDPLPCDDPAGAAVRLALAMRDRMAELCARWKKMGHRLGFGVGISLGYATVGMVGSGGRQDYTASGTAINLASRLCDEALDGEILVSPRAATAIEDSFAVEGRGERSLKGIREPVELFRVVAG